MFLLPSSLALIILQFLSISPFVRAGSVKVNNNPQIRVTTSFANFDARIMDQWSGGGGASWVIGNDSYHPFQGRTFAGAKRSDIRGTRVYGSGYTYNTNYTTLAGRGFPFGTWPIYWDQDLLGCDEYGPQYDGIRPGGQLVTINVTSQTGPGNITAGETYFAIGDRDSIMGTMVSFVTWCNASAAWPVRFDPTLSNSTVRVENVVQYYRASSFALASLNYNNTFARTASPSSNDSTPLPDSIQYSTFYKCLDGVVANALLIMNEPPPKPTPLGVTLGIIFGIFGIPILVGIWWMGLLIISCAEGIHRGFKRRADEKKAALARRNEALAYENYP